MAVPSIPAANRSAGEAISSSPKPALAGLQRENARQRRKRIDQPARGEQGVGLAAEPVEVGLGKIVGYPCAAGVEASPGEESARRMGMVVDCAGRVCQRLGRYGLEDERGAQRDVEVAGGRGPRGKAAGRPVGAAGDDGGADGQASHGRSGPRDLANWRAGSNQAGKQLAGKPQLAFNRLRPVSAAGSAPS